LRDFDGKVAVVTGGASGIGFGLAEKAAKEGMKVVLADVEEKALDAAVQSLRRQEFDITGVLTDVSKPDSVEALRDKAVAAYGKVHLLFNNAGVAGAGGQNAIWDATLKDWQWVFGVNFWGVVNGVRAFLPLMISQGEDGHVVNTGSVAGLVPGNGIYGVTKHAVVSFSESIFSQLTLRQAKVGVSVLCPGWVQTNIITSFRNRPEELRNAEPLPDAATVAASPGAQFIANGMPPSQVADIVFDGVRENRFYILTHDTFDDAIRYRFENILARRNPVPRQPPPQ
jgi:NAD(P)-dependent dehydrogenase (short-subunit alcohol dehydrogenase family)